MFNFRKSEEEKSKIDEFKEKEIYKLILKYEGTPSHHIKTKNGILQSILLLEGKIKETNDIDTITLLQDVKYEVERINKKLNELLNK